MLEIKSLGDFDDEFPSDKGTSEAFGKKAEGGLDETDGFADATEKTITKLVSGVRDANRINVFLDGEFAFSLDVAQVVELQVKVGQKVDAERLGALRSASEFGKLYQRTLEWVLTRPHSIRETRDYLRRRQQKRLVTNRQRVREEKKPFPEIQNETIELAVERLIQRGYLDDGKFADYYVENRFVKKGVSAKRLRMELQKKGVASEEIEAALAAGTRDDEEELRKMLVKKRARYDDQKLIAYLVRQGFDYHKVTEAVAQNPIES